MKKESKSTKDTGHSFADYFKRALNPFSDDNRVRQYYEITSDGISYLRQIEAVYAEMSKAIQQIHQNTGGGNA